MTLAPERMNLYGGRWHEAREALGLLDYLAEDFGVGGLARHTPGVHVRFLILACDPTAAVVGFDDGFWEWWMQDRTNPFDGAARTNWGRIRVPEATAAVRCEREEEWNWQEYLALLRSGGMEFGLGSTASAKWRRSGEEEEIHVFFLTTIVGRIWTALALYTDVVEHLGISGPWELTLALRDSDRAILGNVAAGWAEPQEMWLHDQLRRCPDPNVLVIREVPEWPDADGQRSLAFDFGANVEDAFGMHERRFLGRVDPVEGLFDSSRYRTGD
jgi:hypothetical protein